MRRAPAASRSPPLSGRARARAGGRCGCGAMPGPGAQGSQAPASRASPRLGSLDSVLSYFSLEAAKLGKARSVLKLLQKILKTSEKGTEQTANVHSLVPCGDVVGCLAVHVKLCKDFTSKFNVQHNTNLLLRISVNEVMKCTNPQTFKSQLKKSRKDIVIHFEDVKYFSVQVPRQQRDERNRIILELVGFQGPKDFPRLLGSATVHLYEVIKKGQFTETCAMRIGNMVFCTAEVEFMFCYGSFGYGYSHQLKYPEADLRKTLKHSMFIRIPTPEDRTDPQRGYSAFLSPDMNVTEETLERDIPTTSGVPSDGLEILQSALNKMSPRNRLEKMKKEYRSLKTWPEKAEYLDQLIMKRGPKMTTEQNMASRFKEMVGKIQHTAEEGIESCSDTSADSELQEEQLFGIKTELREDSGLSLRITETVLRSVETDLNFVQEYEESEENLSIPVIAVSASTISQKLSAEKVPENLTRKSSEDEGTIMDSQSIISIALERETKQENSHAKEEIEDLKPAGMLSKGSDLSGLEKYPVIQIQYQQPILSGDKFEPFLRNISRMQSNTQNEKEDDQEVPIFTLLESKFSCVEIKEDQDPPFKASSAIAESSSDVNLSKNGQHLSILKLIESKMELEEGGINGEEEESPALAIRTDLPEKWQEERLSETEIVRLNSFLSNTLEDFLIDRLINIIMLKSVLSKNLEVFIAEKLSELGIVTEVELGEEFQNLQRITDGSPVFLERDLLTKRKDTFKKMLSEAEIINLKSVLSKNLQDRLIERFSETGIITNSELGKQHQYLSLQENKDRSPLVLMTDLAEKMHDSCEQRLSEMEISLKSVVTQNVQDLPIASPLETRLTEEKKLLKEHQNFSFSSTEKRQPKSDAELLKKRNDKSRGKCSEPEIIIKYLSQNLQNNGTKRHSQTAINTKMELEKEHQNHSLPITKVRLPMTIETNSPTIGQDHHKQGVSQQQINLKSASDKTLQDSLIERLLETEIMSLKDFLNKCLHDHLLEKLSETGLIMEEELETVHQNYSLMNILERHPGALETELHNVSQVNFGKSLTKPHIIKGEPVLSGPIQDFLLEVLSETEIRNLKSFLSKKIQDHLVERLSEIGLITEEELRKIHKDLFVLRANERLSRDVESDLHKEEQNLSLKSVLTKNLKDRLSETKLLQLKSLLSKILKEGHRNKLSETEIKSLKSILSNNMQDLPMECISETGLINERELEGVCQNLFLQNAKGKPLIVTDTDILQKGQFHSKQSSDKFTVINEKPILRKEKLELPVENVPEQVTCVVPNLINEAQTNSVIHLPQNNTLERESQDPQSCFDKTEVAHSQTCFDKSLKAKFPNENLKGTLETTGSPSLNAHDIAIQTELKEYLCKPTLSFPVNPQTFIFVHSGSEEETKSPDKSHEKSKGKKKRAKRSKKHAASRYPPQGQVLMCTQFKKEKQIGLNNCKEILKEKQRKHSEPPSPRSCVSGAKKDSKHSTHSNILKKESLTQKAEQEREDGRPKKSLNKSIKIPTATVSELQLQHSAKALQEKSYNYADKKELDMEMFRHLEKAVERALCDLGKVPEVSMSQPLLSAARPHTAPIICSPTKETHRVQPASSYTTSLDSSDTDDPGNATSSESDILESQAQQVEKASEKWAEFCKIVQRILHQNLRPQKDG
ncbi:cation channel sperm-associated targeting subunit tau isoform X2 [Pelodiscus sinensis]|uniref:cation channel sperm-associated targeting subunit tau isoform X2 n=1 Tax=Pelodiscus sinensis TaxID=13735 RepID=UPI003F6BFF53